MKAPICPRVGVECLGHGCEFYDPIPAKPEAFVCRDKLQLMYLGDIAQLLHLVLRSNEQHRETEVQTLRSQLAGKMTPELTRLIGVGVKTLEAT